jgi:small subunit ribosomal protein S20
MILIDYGLQSVSIAAIKIAINMHWTKDARSCKITRCCNWKVIFGGTTLANIKSQIKRNRQNDKRRLRNRAFRGSARAALIKAQEAIKGTDVEITKVAVTTAISRLDKAAEKGVIHKNNAARRKSRLMKALAAAAAK